GWLQVALPVLSAREEQPVAARVGDRHVGANEFVGCGREQQFRIDVPLRTDLGVLEFLRLQDQGAGIKRAELVARCRQIGDAPGGVERHRVDRLYDDCGARRYLFVDPVALGDGVEVKRGQI